MGKPLASYPGHPHQDACVQLRQYYNWSIHNNFLMWLQSIIKGSEPRPHTELIIIILQHQYTLWYWSLFLASSNLSTDEPCCPIKSAKFNCMWHNVSRHIAVIFYLWWRTELDQMLLFQMSPGVPEQPPSFQSCYKSPPTVPAPICTVVRAEKVKLCSR